MPTDTAPADDGGGGTDKMPSPEELLAMLEQLDTMGMDLDQLPGDLKGLVENVKRQKAGAPPAPAVPTEEITPEAGFVIKTCDAASGRKVFINVCASDRVAAPGGWAGGVMPDHVAAALDKKRAADEAEAGRGPLDPAGPSLSEGEVEALRFPLSAGPPRADTDRKGDPCTTIDVVVNADVLRAAGAARRLKQFLVELCLGWVGNKLQGELDMRFKLPKMRYKGEVVQPQTIRADDKRRPLVAEVRDVEEEPTFALRPTKAPPAQQQQQAKQQAAAGPGGGAGGGALAAQAQAQGPAAAPAGGASSASQAAVRPTYSVEYEGRPVEWARITLEPPASGAGPSGRDAVDVSRVRVEVCGRQVYVNNWGGSRASASAPGELSIPLLFAVDGPEAGASAEVGPGGELVVRVPYKPLEQYVDDMRRSAPLPFGKVPLANESYLELEP